MRKRSRISSIFLTAIRLDVSFSRINNWDGGARVAIIGGLGMRARVAGRISCVGNREIGVSLTVLRGLSVTRTRVGIILGN